MRKIQLMTSCNRGNVVLVDFIFSERIKVKKRPALILSTGEYHAGRDEVIIAAITSNTHRTLPGDTLVEEWERAGLLYPSLVTAIIQTIKARMIERVLGSLSARDFTKAQRNLSKALGF